MSAQFWQSRQLRHHAGQILRLGRQIQAHQMNLAQASEKIASLTDELARSIEAKMEIDAIESPVDRIFNDLLQNCFVRRLQSTRMA
jgi:uncharacterized protein Yka (UPF0111/DUF47 family)